MNRPSLPTRVWAFLINRGKSAGDTRIKGAENNMTKDECKDCEDLNIATLQNDNADLKKKVDELTKLNTDLTTQVADRDKKVKDASDALNLYREAEKKGLVGSITQRTEFKADELKDRTVDELRVIHLAIDKVKPPPGTVKNVRGADGVSAAPNILSDGRLDLTKSMMGHPVRQADGSYKWVV